MTGPDDAIVLSVEFVAADGRCHPVALRCAGSGPPTSGDTPALTGAWHDFTVTVRMNEPAATKGRRDVALTVHYTGREPATTSIRLRFDLAPVDRPYWLIPGLFYGENRPAGCDRIFPRFAVGTDEPDAMVADHWEFRADRAATPAVFGWGAVGGVALLTTETSPLGLTGLGLGHDAAAATASVWLGFPFAESPISYDGSACPRPAQRRSYDWQPGETVRCTAEAYRLGPDRHGYAAVLADVHRRWSSGQPVQPWVSVEQAAHLAAEGLLRWHYDPDPGVLLETVGFDRGIGGADGRPVDRQAMHVGWVSGLPWAYALLAYGRRVAHADADAAARSVIDFCCAALSPSGTFWGVWYRDRGWTQSWSRFPRGLHARTLGEATLFLLRSLSLPGVAANPEHDLSAWTGAARSNLDAITARQAADGNVGSVHDAVTGEVLSWAGASGLVWVSALAEAGALDRDGRYLAAAERAGAYYARFVDAEFIHGAPEDVDLAPTSEDGYAAVMAYLSLFRATGAPRWRDLARRAADWMLTFRYTYNVAFDPHTLLGQYRFASRGADQASPANQHLHAYGLICTAELVELSAVLGDPSYAERAVETLTCFRQFVARQDGDFNAYRGMVSERYYQTACFQPKGMLLTLSHAWSVGVLLLACEQMLTPSVQPGSRSVGT